MMENQLDKKMEIEMEGCYFLVVLHRALNAEA